MSGNTSTPPFETFARFNKSRFSELRVVIVTPSASPAFVALYRFDTDRTTGEWRLRHANAGIPPRLASQIADAIVAAGRRLETGGAA